MRSMPRAKAAKIVALLEAVAADPFAHHPNVKGLAGHKHGFRLRVGVWRTIYEVYRAARTFRMFAIRKREDAYR